MIQWLDDFYADPELRGTLLEAFLPAFSGYVSEAIGGPVAANFITALAESYVDRHLGSSRAQLQEVLKDDESLAALQARFDEWEEKRPSKVAHNELVRSANAAQVQQMRERGVTRKVWVASGGSCPYCTGLDGRTVAIEEAFFTPDDEYSPEGAESPMTFTSSIGHPPVHQGCDCSIAESLEVTTEAVAPPPEHEIPSVPADFNPDSAPRLPQTELGQLAREQGTGEGVRTLLEAEIDGDLGRVLDAFDLDSVTATEVHSAVIEMRDMSQRTLIARGLGEEITVYRAGSVTDDVVSVSLDPSVSRFFAGGADPPVFTMSRRDVLAFTDAIAPSGTFAESELFVQPHRLRRVIA